jgi:hypothetical protein
MNRLIPCLAVLSLAAVAAAQTITVGPVFNPANGHRYYRTSGASYQNQLDFAAARGWNLVTIDDAAENIWVRAALAAAGGNNLQCYIGINDRTTEGTFVWQSGDPVLYTNWGAGEPNNTNGNEDIGNIVPSNGLWNDTSPGFNHPAIFEATGPIRVPAEYSSIQAAINIANSGQTILVAPGNYDESIDFGGKDLRLIAEQGPSVTTITTFNAGAGITLQGTSPDACSIEGFTIVPGWQGTLWSVIVEGNAAVRGCRIGGYTNYGVYARGNVTVSDCLFASGGFGGVLAYGLNNSVDVTVQNCTIAGHSIAGIVTETTSAYTAKVRVTNSIVAGNAQPAVIFARSAVLFSNSHVQGGAAGANNSADDPRFVNAPGADTVYRLNDDFTLASDSPCIDTGSNAARVAAGTLDADNRDRFVNATSNANGSIVDRGAFEFQTVTCPVDFNADGFLDFFDYDAFVEAFENGC